MDAQHYVEMILGGVAVIALLLALLVIRALLRVRFFRSPQGQGAPTFTLPQLQQMHQQGQINKQEFEKIKRDLTA